MSKENHGIWKMKNFRRRSPKHKIHFFCFFFLKKRAVSLPPDCFVHRVLLLNSKEFIWKSIFKVFIFTLLFTDMHGAVGGSFMPTAFLE